MSVMIETSLGEVVVDLFSDGAPLASKNFLKLCKIKYYNGCLFYNVQQNFMIQTGDPTATGRGGTSVYGLIYGEQARFFEDEIQPEARKHNEAGLLSMANMGAPNTNGSQFFFAMRGDDMQHLDGKHTIFAKVMEGMEILDQINSQFCDEDGRPYRDIRILHTHVLDDPFDDPPQLVVPEESPVRDRPDEERVQLRIGATDEVSLEIDEKTEIEREKEYREKTAKSNAVVLEMIGDLPDADMKPPENVLFVCKLNPVTTDNDLEIIFTRFGSCKGEIIRDHITGDSLNYAFVEFETIESCEEAFRKMNNVLIDDRRIRVDFSQSVAKEWSKYKSRTQGGQRLASGRGGKRSSQPPSQQAHGNHGRGGTAGEAHGVGRRGKAADVSSRGRGQEADGARGNSRSEKIQGQSGSIADGRGDISKTASRSAAEHGRFGQDKHQSNVARSGRDREDSRTNRDGTIHRGKGRARNSGQDAGRGEEGSGRYSREIDRAGGYPRDREQERSATRKRDESGDRESHRRKEKDRDRRGGGRSESRERRRHRDDEDSHIRATESGRRHGDYGDSDRGLHERRRKPRDYGRGSDPEEASGTPRKRSKSHGGERPGREMNRNKSRERHDKRR